MRADRGDLVLSATSIAKSFGTVQALTDAHLELRAGEIHGLIGPNGSGKSTLLHVIAGHTFADSGHVVLDGTDVTRSTPSARARLGLSIKFQLARVYHEQTVAENLLLALQVRSGLFRLLTSRSRSRLAGEIDLVAREFGLLALCDRTAGHLSHGEQQWLEIAMAMATGPRVLLLDEPTGGMNRKERMHTGELIQAAAQRCAVIIVEHDLDFIRDLCDRITVMHHGVHVVTGTPEDIERDERAKEVYLSRV